MHDSLGEAVDLAQSVRFSGDVGRPFLGRGSLESSEIHYQFNETGLRLSADMTPELFSVLCEVCKRLRILPENVMAYVYASPEIQAACYSADTRDCVITFTSGLVKLMSQDELAFVIGHELGHFLLGHGSSNRSCDDSIEHMIERRCKEISADRVGMLACSSNEAAFRSLIKSAAGLDQEYLRFDVRTYLDQIRHIASDPRVSTEEATHPSLVMRCRALLWFSMSEECARLSGGAGGDPLSQIDKRLMSDLKKFVDGSAHKRISDARGAFEIWLTAAAAIRGGSMTKEEQKIISGTLGPDILKKLMSLFSDCRKSEVVTIVRGKLNEATKLYQSVAPREYASDRIKIVSAVGNRFAQDDFRQFVSDFSVE